MIRVSSRSGNASVPWASAGAPAAAASAAAQKAESRHLRDAGDGYACMVVSRCDLGFCRLWKSCFHGAAHYPLTGKQAGRGSGGTEEGPPRTEGAAPAKQEGEAAQPLRGCRPSSIHEEAAVDVDHGAIGEACGLAAQVADGGTDLGRLAQAPHGDLLGIAAGDLRAGPLRPPRQGAAPRPPAGGDARLAPLPG